MARSTLVFPVLLVFLAYTAAYITPSPLSGQVALLLNNTVYVYGSWSSYDVLYFLDVSIPWNTTNPAWTNHTGDMGTILGPESPSSVIFPAYDNKSFYVWGGPSEYNMSQPTFAQYTLATQQWSLPNATAGMPTQQSDTSAATSSFGVTYIWGGLNGRLLEI